MTIGATQGAAMILWDCYDGNAAQEWKIGAS
jgi:hypothetical protein